MDTTFFEEHFSPNFTEPANYEFVTIYGKKMKMEGIFREELDIDEKFNPTFWIWIPKLSDQWLVWFQQKYIKEVRRTPVAYKGDVFNLYRPEMVIYHPEYEIRKINEKVIEIKITGGSLWKPGK